MLKYFSTEETSEGSWYSRLLYAVLSLFLDKKGSKAIYEMWVAMTHKQASLHLTCSHLENKLHKLEQTAPREANNYNEVITV